MLALRMTNAAAVLFLTALAQNACIDRLWAATGTAEPSLPSSRRLGLLVYQKGTLQESVSATVAIDNR